MIIAGERRATDQGVQFWLAGLNPGVLEVVRASGLAEKLGRERMLFNARTVIQHFLAEQSVTIKAPEQSTPAQPVD
jgi:hypothetical protein